MLTEASGSGVLRGNSSARNIFPGDFLDTPRNAIPTSYNNQTITRRTWILMEYNAILCYERFET